MALADQDMKAAIAVTRFGLGAKPGEIAQARQDPQGFLKSQIRRSGADKPAGSADSPPQTSVQRMAQFRDYQRERRQIRLEKVSDVRPSAPAGPNPAMAGAPTTKDVARDPVKVVGNILRRDISTDFTARTSARSHDRRLVP